MLIAFFVNDMAKEYANYTTTVLAHAARERGHKICYLTPSDFVLHPDDRMSVHARFVPQKRYGSHGELFEALQKVASRTKTIDVTEIDLLMLRNDPALDAQAAPWAMEVGILFGREAAKRGVLVLNDPDSLGRAINKLYFQSFPEEVRADTLITKNAEDVRAFARDNGGNIILKPLRGSGGQSVFKVDKGKSSNLNQIIEAIERDGYVIAQAYVPAARKGDIRLFLMNGRPLIIGSKYAAVRRVASSGDIRSNVHAGATTHAATIGKTELEVAERVRPKLIADGMFLVGLDIVGNKILEVNVFSPGNLNRCNEVTGENFAIPIVEAIERKLAIAREFGGTFGNRELASL